MPGDDRGGRPRLPGNGVLSYWYMALAEPKGIIIHSTEPRATIAALYSTRAKAGDPALLILEVRDIAASEAALGGNIAILRKGILGRALPAEASGDVQANDL